MEYYGQDMIKIFICLNVNKYKQKPISLCRNGLSLFWEFIL